MPYRHFNLLSFFQKHNGLLSLRNKIPIKDNYSLSLVYTPGVGQVCLEIQKNPQSVLQLTNKSNSLLVITDSTGFHNYNRNNWHNNIAIPHVEGASFYYKTLANIDAYPIVLDHALINSGSDLLETVLNLAPAYSAIELYSINESRLKDYLDLYSKTPMEAKSFVLFTSLERTHLKTQLKANKLELNPLFLVSCFFRSALDTHSYEQIPMELIDKTIQYLISRNENLKNENLYTQANRIVKFCTEYFLSRKALPHDEPTAKKVALKFERFLVEGSEAWYEPIPDDKFNSSKLSLNENSMLLHKRLIGMIESNPKMTVRDPKALNQLFSEEEFDKVSEFIAKNPDIATKITCKRNFSAIITNGTAVLGFGDIGTLAGLPVMEGKSCLFKQLGGVDLVPLCINEKKPDKFRLIVERVAPIFNAINLEDIKAPECFEIEKPLEAKLDIPIFHDDQHGTAIVVIAGILNALKLVDKQPKDLKIIVNGGGAAGLSITELLLMIGVKNIIICDTQGAIYKGRKKNMNKNKEQLAELTNPNLIQGLLQEVIKGADVFIGVSAGKVLTQQMVKTMGTKPIVFALANPIPEILPHEAKAAGAYIIATGRSDFKNQVNNSLAFPGIFRGILDVRAHSVTLEMKMAAARAIASLVHSDTLNPDYIIPNALDSKVPIAVSKAVAEAALKGGVAKDKIDPDFVEENTRHFLVAGGLRTTKFISI